MVFRKATTIDTVAAALQALRSRPPSPSARHRSRPRRRIPRNPSRTSWASRRAGRWTSSRAGWARRSRRVRQAVIVENKPGAGSNIAIRALIDSAPDGCTVMNAEIRKALDSPEVMERLAALGAEVSPSGPEQLGAMVRSERERYGKLIREAKIQAN